MDKKTDQAAVHMPAKTKITIARLAEQEGLTVSEWILRGIHRDLQSLKDAYSVLEDWEINPENDEN